MIATLHLRQPGETDVEWAGRIAESLRAVPRETILKLMDEMLPPNISIVLALALLEKFCYDDPD